MQCITPITVRNKTKDINNQNLFVTVPCSKCVACLKRRTGHWSFRINQEAKISSSAAFLTLTYAEEPKTDNGYPTLVKKDFQDFFKRLRKTTNNKLKYYACGEYGTRTKRPHYHAIVFNLPHSFLKKPEKLDPIWGHGHTMLTHSNALTINYVVGYINKGTFERSSVHDDRLKEFSLMSKKMGMNYLTPQMIEYYKQRQVACIIHEDGHILSMPRYYKQKIFTKKELKIINDEYQKINAHKFDIQTTEEARLDLEAKKMLIYKNEKQLKLKRVKL